MKIALKTLSSLILPFVFLISSIGCESPDESMTVPDRQDGDIDNAYEDPMDGDVVEEGDSDIEDSTLLLQFRSLSPGNRHIQLTIHIDGNYSMRYNYSGEELLTEQQAGRLDSSTSIELTDYLNARLPDLVQNSYMELGTNCREGELLFNSNTRYSLHWHCSEDPSLINMLSYVHAWIDFNLMPESDGDDDEDMETENEIEEEAEEEWEGICEGPGEYEKLPKLDYFSFLSGKGSYSLLLYPDRLFRLEHIPEDEDTAVVEGELSTVQFDSLMLFIEERLKLLDCFEGRWCDDGPFGHIYFFATEEQDGDSEMENLYVDFRCPDDPIMLQVMNQIESLIENWLLPTDGDIDEYEEQEEEIDEENEEEPDLPPDCDDGNDCTIDTYDSVEGNCHYSPMADGSRCDDGRPGTYDECKGGRCIGVNAACIDWPPNEKGFCETNIMGNGSDSEPMIYIPPNSFSQGFLSDDCEDLACNDAKPAHDTTLQQGYWIDKFEATSLSYYFFAQDHSQWQTLGDNPCGSNYGDFSAAPFNGRRPVAEICWYAAQAYCRWTGKRLVSEAEWEYAARGPNSNPDGRRYPWGDADPHCGIVNYGDRNGDGGSTDPCINHSVDIGNFDGIGPYEDGSSRFGVHDLAGNVSEWVYDSFAAYSSEDQTNPLQSVGGSSSVRGGSYLDSALRIRGAFRKGVAKINASEDLGFRCAAPQFDLDRDGISDFGSSYCRPGESFYCEDNCISTANPGQENADGAFPGDACEEDPMVNGDVEDCETVITHHQAEDVASRNLSLPADSLLIVEDTLADEGSLLVLDSTDIGNQLVVIFELDMPFAGKMTLDFLTREDAGSILLFMDSPLNRAMVEDDHERDPLSLHKTGEPEIRSLSFSELTLKRGMHRLVLKVVGKRLASSGYKVTLDRIVLENSSHCGE